MTIYKCIIADDEDYALDILENYISKVDSLQIIARCSDSFDVYNNLHKHTVDVLFLDIEMPQLSGIDLLKSLKNPPKVIFTTAYKDYAVNAFELNAVDYLLKPFSFERFLKSIDKLTDNKIPIVEENPGFLDIIVDRQKIRILLKDINFIEGLGNYLKVHTEDKTYITYQTIKTLLELLPPQEFRQIHKSYIIPLSKVQSYNSTSVLIGKNLLPVGRIFKLNLSL
jgi:DNA-binding LytR/AlgR family response regulator